MTAQASAQIALREPTGDDSQVCAQIVFDAFGGIHDLHHFTRDFPVVEAAIQMIAAWIPHPAIWGVLGEIDGRVVGSNFLDERDPIRGVGPITVAPDCQGRGVGRKLMEAVIDRGGDAPGIRLLQDAFNMRSLSLYRSLGFEVEEPLAVMTGTPHSGPASDVGVRPMEEGDLEQCEALSIGVHGFPRTNSLRDALLMYTPFVAEREGRVVAYSASAGFWQMNHGVAETESDMEALLRGAAAAAGGPLALLVPLRSDLFRWCLAEGLRLVKPMNLMAIGDYQEPRGAWFPSVLY